MERVYQYPKYRGYVGLLITIIVLGGVFGSILIDAIYSKNILYLLIALSVFALVLYAIFKGIQNLRCKYILNDVGITIEKPFADPVAIRWSEIIEFGKRRTIGMYPYWEFFIRTNDTNYLKIGSEYIEKAEEFVSCVFKKAVRAKFTTVENVSSIPFFRKDRPKEWNIETKE